jgi:two-component system, NarL family, sensor kinase
MNDAYFTPLVVSGTLLLAIFIFFIVFILLIQKDKQNKAAIDKNRLIYDHQKQVLAARIEEQENTMTAISRELHDNIAAHLSYIRNMLTNLRAPAAHEEQMKTLIPALLNIDNTISNIRNISHNLNSDYIKVNSLIDLLHKETEFVGLAQGIKCDMQISDHSVSFTPQAELLIYRIVTEAMQNVLKHAHATSLSVDLNYGEHDLCVTITDNGVGFHRNKIYELNGIGMINMMQRAKLLNGTMDFSSTPGHGSVVSLRIPDTSDICVEDDVMIF